METCGHKVTRENEYLSLLDGRLKFEAQGNLYEHFVYKPTRNRVRNAVKMEFGDDGSELAGKRDHDMRVDDRSKIPQSRPVVE